MRLREFQSDQTKSDLEAHILTVLEFLRTRSHNDKLLPSISTGSLIGMVNNTSGFNLDPQTLMSMVKSNDGIKNLVKSIDAQTIHLKPFGDEPGAENNVAYTNSGSKAKDPTKTVDAMAKRASDLRS